MKNTRLLGLVAVLSAAAAIVIACATAGTPTTCDTGQVECGGTCTSTTNDNQNCGACGTACASGQVCSGGKCGSSCGTGETNCSGSCVTTDNDPKNCGACGKGCGTQKCVGGQCQVGGGDGGDGGNGCPQNESPCTLSDGGVACVNEQTDDNHCGSCTNACASDQACTSGQCILQCDGGTNVCIDASVQYCTDFTSDNQNCGGCFDICDAATLCQSSKCVAPTVTAVEIFPPTGTLYDPGSASVWSVRAYTVTFAQSQTIDGVEWKANLATTDSIHAEIWNTSQTQLALGSNVSGAGTEQFYKSPISYTVQANTQYVIGIYMTNVNTVLPRKDSPTYPFTVSGPHGNITVSACWSTVTTTDVFPSSTNTWGPDFKFDIQ